MIRVVLTLCLQNIRKDKMKSSLEQQVMPMEMLAVRGSTLQSSRWLQCIATPGRFLAVVAGYFVLQVLLRLIASNTTGIDESEQLLLTQQIAPGYGPQPPLYTWLQYPFVALFGPTVLPLTLLKNLLLFGIYAMTYLNARLVARNHWLAVTATISVLFIPQISWEAQRDLTHSVLLTALSTTTFYFFLKVSQAQKLGDYLGFGVCAAMGLLAKYNFAVFLVGLLAAGLTLPALRKVILDTRMVIAMAVCAAIVAPHVWWALHNQDAVFATAHKFGIRAERPWLDSTFAGLGSLFGSIAAHIGPLLGVYLIVCWKRTTSSTTAAPAGDIVKLITRTIGFILGLLLLAVLAFKVCSYKDRWMLPVFFWLPILLVVKCAARLDVVRTKSLLGFAAAVAVVICVLIPVRVRLVPAKPGAQCLQAPFEELCRQIAEVNPDARLFIAEDKWLGGNLRHFMPGRSVVSADRVLHLPAALGDGCLIVWGGSRNAAPPEALTAYAGGIADVDFSPDRVRFAEAPMKFQKTGVMRLAYVTGVIKAKPN